MTHGTHERAQTTRAILGGVPDEPVATRHAAFVIAASALLNDCANAELARVAYQLLVEMHALGAPVPAYIDLPWLTWEIDSPNGIFSAAIVITQNQWNFHLNGATVHGRPVSEQGHLFGSAREMAEYIQNRRLREEDPAVIAAREDYQRRIVGEEDGA